MRTALALATGLLWTATYLLIIRRSFADKTYGMPIVALAANISWEFIFAFVHPSGQPQRTINIVWFLFDLAIVFTVIRFGGAEFKGLPRLLFLPGLAVILVLSYLGVLLFANTIDNGQGTIAAFASNLLMSALFLSMLWSRWSGDGDPLRGQSIWIGITKLLGTVCASAMVFFTDPDYDGSALLGFLYLAVLLLDASYVAFCFFVRQKPTADANHT